MATWHQLQRPVTLNQPNGWTIVSDPPNGLRTLTTGFSTRDEAEQRLAVWRANNPEGHRHCYIAAPAKPKMRYVMCEACESSFRLPDGASIPPHRTYRGTLCEGKQS